MPEWLLEGRVALITGASRGIGKATAIAMAMAGARLAITARERSHLEATFEEIREIEGDEPLLLAYDVGSPDAVKKAFAEVASSFDRLDILVNNAAVLEEAPLGQIRAAQIAEVTAINIEGVLHHMQFAAEMMSGQRSGAIVNLAALQGMTGQAFGTLYSASKAAVIGATLSAAKELAHLNVRVNAIAPGVIETDMAHQLSEDRFAQRLARIRMGRIGSPFEVAAPIVFLASDMASYISGHVLCVDGCLAA